RLLGRPDGRLLAQAHRRADPLREPLVPASRRTDAAVVAGDDAHRQRPRHARLPRRERDDRRRPAAPDLPRPDDRDVLPPGARRTPHAASARLSAQRREDVGSAGAPGAAPKPRRVTDAQVRAELRNPGYEILILALSVLSLVNLILLIPWMPLSTEQTT